MVTLIQIILINLVVSFDNVGVIALATRNLPEEQANLARKVGVVLSFVLKVVFLLIIQYLFELKWLHIRVVGGILLLYVAYQMLQDSENTLETKEVQKSSFLSALISIVAVDVSMSLDNIVAVISIVTTDQAGVTGLDMILICVGLLACIPILFWFSTGISKLMEKYALITYLCGGYLVYLAVKMIFADEMIGLFFESIGFTFTLPVAIMCGIMIILYGIYHIKVPQKAYYTNRMLLVSSLIVLFSIVQIISTTFLVSKSALADSPQLIEYYLNFIPSGANAIYTLSEMNTIFPICIIIIVTNVAKAISGTYFKRLGYCIRRVIFLVLLSVSITTFGFTYVFGFGSISIIQWLMYLSWQIILFSVYTSLCFLLATIFTNKRIFIISGIIFLYIQEILSHILLLWNTPMISFSLRYYMVLLPDVLMDTSTILLMMLVTTIYTFFSVSIGHYIGKKQAENRISLTL